MMDTLHENNPKPSWQKSVFKQIDNSALIAFRIIFGFLMLIHCTFLFVSGALEETYIKPSFTFSFIGFEFIRPLPGIGMYFFVGALALFALMIMFAAWYRIGAIGFSVLWTLLYLMQKADYNNYYYLVLLFSWILAFMPANRYFSYDVKRKAVHESCTCSKWIYMLFIFQMSVIYLYSAVYRLSPEWLSGSYFTIAFTPLATDGVLDGFYSNPAFPKIVSWGSMIISILIIPLLLRRRTSIMGFILAGLLQVFNFITFNSGPFPFLMIAANLFFLDPELVRRLLFPNKPSYITLRHIRKEKAHKLTVKILVVYMLLQLLLPLRTLLYPGNCFWTDEGYKMSWMMMMRKKTGNVTYKVIHPASNSTWRIQASERFSLNQTRRISTSPDMIWQFAQQLRNEFKQKGYGRVEVYAISLVSLNNKPYRPLIDSTVDLAAQKWSYIAHSSWISK